jgi:hypothetical protein
VGVATITAAAVVAIPPPSPATMPAAAAVQPAQMTPRIDLAASVRSLVTTPPNPEHFAAATAAMGRIDPASAAAVVQAAAPVPLNAASDFIVSGYQFIRYWVSYGVQLADYVLGFIPFGYAIADQVNIFYYSLILPISDSIVYNLVVPVVNDPLNPASYVNGLIAVGQTSVNAAINTGIAEFNYFFGWLIPPLPPLPLAAAHTLLPEDEVTTLATDLDPTLDASTDAKKASDDSLVTQRLTTLEPAAANAPAAPVSTATVETTQAAPETPKPPTTTSVDGVQAQGEVRGGTQVTIPTTSTTTTNTSTGSEPMTNGTETAPAAASETGSNDIGPADKDTDKDTEKPADKD